MRNAANIIEHLLNNHRNCDKTWCYAKHVKEKKKIMYFLFKFQRNFINRYHIKTASKQIKKLNSFI